MAEALKRVKLSSGFCPVAMGARAGLNKLQAEAAARALSNAGVLVLGFDMSAQFSADFRKSRTPIDRSAGRKKVKIRKAARRARSAELVAAGDVD